MKNIPRAFFIWQALIAVTVVAGLALAYRGWQWDSVRSGIRRAHPQLQLVEPVDLARWLSNNSNARPLLFDVRTPRRVRP